MEQLPFYISLLLLFILGLVQREILIYRPDLQEQGFASRESHFLSSTRVRFVKGQGKPAWKLPD